MIASYLRYILRKNLNICTYLLTWYEMTNAYDGNTQDPTEHKVHHQGDFSPKRIDKNKRHNVSSQFDSPANHEIEVSIST